MCMRAAQHSRLEHIRAGNVRAENRFARYLVDGVGATSVCANGFEWGLCVRSSFRHVIPRVVAVEDNRNPTILMRQLPRSGHQKQTAAKNHHGHKEYNNGVSHDLANMQTSDRQ